MLPSSAPQTSLSQGCPYHRAALIAGLPNTRPVEPEATSETYSAPISHHCTGWLWAVFVWKCTQHHTLPDGNAQVLSLLTAKLEKCYKLGSRKVTTWLSGKPHQKLCWPVTMQDLRSHPHSPLCHWSALQAYPRGPLRSCGQVPCNWEPTWALPTSYKLYSFPPAFEL